MVGVDRLRVVDGSRGSVVTSVSNSLTQIHAPHMSVQVL